MNPGEISWETVGVAVLLALVSGTVPVVIAAVLGRKNANKRLELDETTVMLSGTNSQIATYKDLLDRANAAVVRAEQLNKDFSKQLEELEQQKRDQDWKITTLRTLFSRVIGRNGIKLTPDEQQLFDSTKPIREVRNIRRSVKPT